MISRRTMLVGGGAAAVAVAAGGWMAIGESDRQRVLHKVGLADSPDQTFPPSGREVQTGTFDSAHMPAPVSWALARPEGAAAGVVYCLHGYGEDERFAFDTIGLHDAAALAGAPLAVAAVDGDPDSYWHPRADGRDPRSMLLEEFVPMVDDLVGTDHRALLGWSMGGYGALLAAETRPELFVAVAGASPALWTEAGASAPGAFDDAQDYERNDVFAGTDRLTMTVRIDCGTGDPFYAADRTFAAQLQPPPQGGFGDGFHDAAYWRSVAPAQIQTITAAMGAT